MSFLGDLGAVLGEIKTTTNEIKKTGNDFVAESLKSGQSIKKEASKVTEVLSDITKKDTKK